MSVCASCGVSLPTNSFICPHHLIALGEDWSRANKIWCDYLHRGVEIPRLHPEPLTSDMWDCYAYGTVDVAG